MSGDNVLINFFIRNDRATLVLFFVLVMSGIIAYTNVAKESTPDITVPIVYISAHMSGISPTDCDRMITEPIRKEITSIDGIKSIDSYALEDRGYLIVELHSNASLEKALRETRDKINEIKHKLPRALESINIEEINLSLFPIINVILKSSMPDRQFFDIAYALRDSIEMVPDVLSVNIIGNREEVIEIILQQETLELYQISLEALARVLDRYNAFHAVGTLKQSDTDYTLQINTTIESVEELLNIPVLTKENAILRLKDVAKIRRTFKKPTTTARVNGQPALVLEVSKKLGSNVIDTIDAVKAVAEDYQKHYDRSVLDIIYTQDSSVSVLDLIRDLENNILFSIIVVLCVIVLFSNVRSALLVSITIPGSFFIAILGIHLLGYTINMVVLFSLILSVGILVDAAVVVVEYSDRLLCNNRSPLESFREAATKMFYPVLASAFTTKVVFVPLLFWPGIIGKFIKFLPLTVILVLTGSLFLSLICIPIIGYIINAFLSPPKQSYVQRVIAIEQFDTAQFDWLTRLYEKALRRVLHHPFRFTAYLLLGCTLIIGSFGFLSKGIEFFPEIEPDNAALLIRARGNLSLEKKSEILATVESRIFDMHDEIRAFYTRIGGNAESTNIEKDIIGTIFLEFVKWDQRRKADTILDEILQRLEDIPGIAVNTIKEASGPPKEAALQVLLTSKGEYASLLVAARRVKETMRRVGGFTMIKDSTTPNAINWKINFYPERAALFGVDKLTLVNHLQLFTDGFFVGKYIGDLNQVQSDGIDTVVLLDPKHRTLSGFLNARLNTGNGTIVSMKDFTDVTPTLKRGSVERVNGDLAIRVHADVLPGVIANTQITKLLSTLQKDKTWDPKVKLTLEGEQEDMLITQRFLGRAFLVSIFGITIVLLLLFNSLLKVGLIMGAVLFSTVGVLLGILFAHSSFGIVMCGMAIITLAGISVNNNILLLDEYEIQHQKHSVFDAIMISSISRLRPILLTTITTALGLAPMVARVNIDFIRGDIHFNPPSSQLWVQLSSAIAGGILFATVITLFFTPSMLLLAHIVKEKYQHLTIKIRSKLTPDIDH